MADREEDSESGLRNPRVGKETNVRVTVSDAQAQEEEEMEQKIINEGESAQLARSGSG